VSRPHEVHAIEAALRLAALGFKIQPGHGVGPNGECSCRLGAQCESIGKHPRPDDNGKAIEPTTDAETLRRHFTRWPFASVRIATGNGLLGLDVDPRNGGDASLAALEAEHGPLPDTVTVQTGGGGRHYYFGCDPGARIGHKAEIAPGVELCHGHALTTPPSRHASGDMYRWAEGRAPEQIELAEAPPWLVALAPPADARTRSAPIGERIPKGQRHTDLVSLAGSLRARGFDAEEIYQTLSTVNVRRCDPQYPDVDVRRIADDFGRKDGGTLDTESKSPPQAARLVDFAHEADLFLSPFGMPYASVEVGEHRETWPLKSAGFRGWLAGRYHAKVGSIPRTQAMQGALGSLVEETAFKGKVAEVHVRVASHGGVLYLDLADAERKVVEMTADGWRIVTDPPVRFRRPKGMLPLPMPERGGSLDDLVRFLNVKAEAMLLVQAWLVSLLQPDGSQPILVAHGEQGSAKSTLAQLVKRVVDPSKAPLRSEPRDPRDLMIAAVNSRVVAYDNLSHLPPALSDALCRLSTGGGLSTRELFTDAEETILEAKRPVILTGIEELATRPDLLDRCILTYLPAIPEDKRRVESAILRDFDAAHPRILGALLDAAVAGLRNLPTVRLDRLPRMADFTLWVAACAPALGFSTERSFTYCARIETCGSPVLSAPFPPRLASCSAINAVLTNSCAVPEPLEV
jgi:hypothetical protein